MLILALILLTLFPVTASSQSVATGGRHSLAICADGTVNAWGYNGFGQLGNGTTSEQASGTPVSGLTSVRMVAGGLFHSLFLMEDSTVRSCGRNVAGPLGDGTTTDRWTPVPVTGLDRVVTMSAGGEHSLFVAADGSVWSCGANGSGQLGHGTITNVTVPTRIAGLQDIVQVAAGAEFSLFLDRSGRVWACGDNAYGQLGTGTGRSSRSPVLINDLTSVRSITAGEWHSVFVMKDGTVFSCGRNTFGQLGNGTRVNAPTPERVPTLSGIIHAEAGGIHTLFIGADGRAWSCGLNSGGNNDGQLGDGTEDDRSIPVEVMRPWGSIPIIDAHAAREHTLFVLRDGTLWSCGRNNYGQLGIGRSSTANRSTPVAASSVCLISVPTSVLTIPSSERVHLAPNPFQRTVRITIDPPLQRGTLTIHDIHGRCVRTSDGLHGSDHVIDRERLPSGVYRIVVIDGAALRLSESVIILD